MEIGKMMLLAFAIALTALAFSASAETITLQTLKIENASLYTPYPAEPGQYLDVSFTIQNSLSVQSEAIVCEVVPQYPFSIDPNENPIKEIGSLPAKASAIIQYKLRVASDAVDGNNKLPLKCKVGDKPYSEGEFSIFVQNVDPNVEVQSFSVSPTEIEPGKSGTITINVKNLGGTNIKDVTLTLALDDAGIPLAPSGGVSEYRQKILAAGAVMKTSFDVTVLPNAQANVYKIPLLITYSDNLGKKYSHNYTVSATVGGKPEIFVSVEQTNLIRGGTRGTVSLKIINKGLTPVKFLAATLKESSEYTIISSDTLYVGKLDSDDEEGVEYTVYLNSGLHGEVKLPLEITFKDANNNEYREMKEVSLRLYSPEEIKQLELEQQAAPNFLLIAIVLAIVAFLVWKYVLKRKKQ